MFAAEPLELLSGSPDAALELAEGTAPLLELETAELALDVGNATVVVSRISEGTPSVGTME